MVDAALAISDAERRAAPGQRHDQPIGDALRQHHAGLDKRHRARIADGAGEAGHRVPGDRMGDQRAQRSGERGVKPAAPARGPDQGKGDPRFERYRQGEGGELRHYDLASPEKRRRIRHSRAGGTAIAQPCRHRSLGVRADRRDGGARRYSAAAGRAGTLFLEPDRGRQPSMRQGRLPTRRPPGATPTPTPIRGSTPLTSPAANGKSYLVAVPRRRPGPPLLDPSGKPVPYPDPVVKEINR